jgi:hypothetical protein
VSIVRIASLSPEAQNIEAKAIAQVKQSLDALIEEYPSEIWCCRWH